MKHIESSLPIFASISKLSNQYPSVEFFMSAESNGREIHFFEQSRVRK